MTQQYLAGELSLRLAQLQELAADDAARSSASLLRHQAETAALPELASIARRAIELVDALCWKSVTHGDVTAFSKQSATAAELYEFSVCAGLLRER